MALALLVVFTLDEIGSGVGPAAAPRIASDHSIDPGHGAGTLIAAFYALAIFVEPLLLRFSERVRARRWITAWLLVLGAVMATGALAGSYGLFLVALALYGPASGAVCGVSEGALVESRPEARERTMAHITLAGALGDLLVPVLLAAVAAVGGGWRAVLGMAAAAAIVLAVPIASSRELDRRFAGPKEEGEAAPPRMRDALRRRELVGWSLARSLASLMDEVLAAFAAVHVHARVSADPVDGAIAMGFWIAGGLAGLAVLDRALARFAPARILAPSGAAALPVFATLVVARDFALACGALALLGALVSTYHPLASARAYASMPGHPGVVNAVAALWSPLELLAPLALGAVAEVFGPPSALGTLAIVPVVMLAIGLAARDDGARGSRVRCAR